MPQCNSLRVLRYLSLMTGCLASGTAYTLDAFTVYSGDFKTIFGAKQSQVEMVISMGYIGLLSSLPAGLAIRRVGARVLSVIAGISSTLGAVLAWSSLYAIDYYKDHLSLFNLHYFLMGFGGGIMYVTASTINMDNFDDSALGLVSGLLHAFRSGVPGLLMVLYMYTFSADYNDTAYMTSRFSTYFVLLAICYGIANILGIVFYDNYRDVIMINIEKDGDDNTSIASSRRWTRSRSISFVKESIPASNSEDESDYDSDHSVSITIYSESPDMTSEDMTSDVSANDFLHPDSGYDHPPPRRQKKRYPSGPMKPHDTERTPLMVAKSTMKKDRSILQILRQVDFHLLYWSSIVLLGYRTSFGSNIRTFADSFDLYEYAQIILTVLPVISTFSKPPIGWCSDYFLGRIPRSAFLVVWTVFTITVNIFCIFFMDLAAMQCVAVIVIILCSSYIQTLAPPLMVTMFGRTFFPIGWSLITVGWAGFTSGYNTLIGLFYDMHVAEGSNDCKGLECYTYSFLIAVLTSILALVLYSILLYRELRTRTPKLLSFDMEASLSIHT